MRLAEATQSAEEYLAEVVDTGRIGRQQILVVALCMLFNALDGFDISAMSVVASAVAQELTLSPERLGWIFSFALAGMMAGAMLLAPLADRWGRRTVTIASMALVGVTILATASAETLGEFIALRFLSGIGAGAMLASQAALAAEYSPAKYRAAAVALVTSGYPLGAMMTSVVGGFVIPEFGWRGMFFVGGVTTIVMVVLAFLLLPESLKYLLERRPNKALDRANVILRKMGRDALAVLPEVVRAETQTSPRFGILEPGLRTKTLILWTAFLLTFSTLYFLMSWIPALVEGAGQTTEAGRDAFFLFNVGGVLGIYLMSFASTRWKLTNVVCVLSLAAGAAMVLFAGLPTELTLMMVLILLIGILQQGGFTGLYSTAAKLYPTEQRSTGVGWAIGLGRFGAVVGPAVAGYLLAAGFTISGVFFFFAVPMAVGGLEAYRLHVE